MNLHDITPSLPEDILAISSVWFDDYWHARDYKYELRYTPATDKLEYSTGGNRWHEFDPGPRRDWNRRAQREKRPAHPEIVVIR